MTKRDKDFTRALDAIGYGGRGGQTAFADFIGITDRQVRRYVETGDAPKIVWMMICVLQKRPETKVIFEECSK